MQDPFSEQDASGKYALVGGPQLVGQRVRVLAAQPLLVPARDREGLYEVSDRSGRRGGFDAADAAARVMI